MCSEEKKNKDERHFEFISQNLAGKYVFRKNLYHHAVIFKTDYQHYHSLKILRTI